MKIRNILFAICLACASSSIIGCNVAEKGVQKYDTLVDKDEACNMAWSDYESNLQRRADMIPQLVSVVKGSAAHEETTLIAVTQARANATRPEIKLDPKSDDFTDPVKVAAFQKAQSQLGASMSRLLVANEAYPQLQANGAFHDLQVQIEGTENRLLRAREQYNKAVASFNTELRHVTGKIINPMTGHEFKQRVYFTVDADAKVAPKIDFGTPAGASAVVPASK
ncbi:LemA Uncharacterized conserved protein [uncultured Caudovirales phage]|uniref:LemA Uncharacterized conserved protein n=1 Tax=uncultured Caudovirales phage TaxID=2100421 RepID=A0A6J5RT66_9CAUD|nr:LemA Uncharacterized conserved protein [uncultured Caudovirales phage]